MSIDSQQKVPFIGNLKKPACASKVQRADLTCDVIRKVALFVLSKL